MTSIDQTKKKLPEATRSVLGNAATADIQLGRLLEVLKPWAFGTLHNGFFFIEPHKDNILGGKVIKKKMFNYL